MFGRRGTGKTHALYYLADAIRKQGALPIYVDLRTIGSTGGVYNDPRLPLAERGTRLLLDVLETVHTQIVDAALALAETTNVTQSLALLDALADEITSEVRVVGSIEREAQDSRGVEGGSQSSLRAVISTTPAIEIGGSSALSKSESASHRIVESGVAQHAVHFGAVAGYLSSIVEALPVDRIWLLLDEWSSVPIDLQPLLADLFRRCVLPVRGITLKIAAIEQRSEFHIPRTGDYMGIELGADVAADLDLDDFLVFGNDANRAKEFFAELLFRHVVSFCEDDITDSVPTTAAEFIQASFTQQGTFAELVRAAEGVPRDAINVANLAAMKANDEAISLPVLRGAARTWYLRDKEAAATVNPDARDLLHWVIDEVIGERQARAFLLRQGEDRKHPLIRTLYDARVLHLVKKGVASKDQPGVRFNVYGLDYGCYVELSTTAKEPSGLFMAELDDGAESYVQVPKDDYRSIRRAVLDLDAFESRK